MKLVKFIITLVLLWGSQSWGQMLEPIPSGMIYKLEGQVNELGGQGFGIRITTKEPYDCEGPMIRRKLKVKGDRITVNVQGVQISDNCEGRMNFATTYIDLKDLEPGTYIFSPIVHRHILKAELIVSEKGYLFRSDEDATLVEIPNEALNRIPEGTIWGTCTFPTELREKAGEFFIDLEEMGAKRVNLVAGNYGEFYVHDGSTRFNEMLEEGIFRASFYYNFTGSFEELRALVMRYGEGLKIKISDLKGNKL